MVIAPTAITQALGLTHWKAAAPQKPNGLRALAEAVPTGPEVAIFQARYSR
ncbi:hypothetical protein D3C79_1002070 [compost metagenome]